MLFRSPSSWVKYDSLDDFSRIYRTTLALHIAIRWVYNEATVSDTIGNSCCCFTSKDGAAHEISVKTDKINQQGLTR
jgi:hypothetical protein